MSNTLSISANQLRTGDAFGESRGLEASRPEQGHAVGEDEVGLLVHFPQLGPLVVEAELVEVWGDDPPAATARELAQQVVDRLPLGDRVDRHAHQADAGGQGRRRGRRRR